MKKLLENAIELKIIKMFGRLFYFAIEIVSIDFVELSTVHLLKRKPRFCHMFV